MGGGGAGMERSQNYRIKFSHLVVFYFLALNVVAHFKFFLSPGYLTRFAKIHNFLSGDLLRMEFVRYLICPLFQVSPAYDKIASMSIIGYLC